MSTPAFGKYVVTRLLGRGGMAEVYLARDPRLDRNVAIKIILPQFASEAGFAERFLQEAKLVASLRHPHIVELYDYDVVNNQPFMVTEHLDGGSLQTRLKELRERGQLLSFEQSARILDAMANALDYAHARGAIHRDVKPSNILFTSSNEPALCSRSNGSRIQRTRSP